MGEPIIILLLLFGLATASQVLPNGCPADFSVHRLLRHETECDKYYSCSNGQRILMTCPANTLFDYDLQICNHAFAVVCETHPTTEFADTTTEFDAATTEFVAATTELADATTGIGDFLPNDCPADYTVHLLLSHETDCDKFYICSNGQKILFTCPGGTLFDSELQVCNWAHAVSCTSLSLETTTFSQGFTTTITVLDDMPVETFSTSSSSSSSKPEYTTDFLTTEAAVSPPSVCPDGLFGNVPHPDMCDSYYVCTGWDPIQLFCLPGYEFDPELQTCTEITEGGCTWLQQQHTTTERYNIISDSTIESDATEDLNTISTNSELPTTTETTLTTQETTVITNEVTETTFAPTTIAQLTTTKETSTPEATTETENVTGVTETTTELNPVTPSICPDGFFGSVPHPEICDSYYVCTGWDPIQLFCLPGFEFDLQLQTCVEIAEGGCTWHQQQHTTPESEIIPETTEGTNTSTTAFEPATTPEIAMTTTETTFEPTTEAQFTTTRESGTAETEDVSVDATTMEMNPTNPSICPDGFFGSVPHPEICDSYYVCTGWDPIQLFCLPGFEFDLQIQTCVEIAEGGCTWNQQQHTTTERDIISDSTIVSDTTEDLDTKSTTSELPTTTETTMTTQETTVITNEVTETTFAPTTIAQLTTTKETSTPEATTETENVTGVTETTTELNPVTPSICPDGFFGSVPHPEICDSYYVCTGWDPIQLFCLPGLEFDLQLQTCVEIAEGGCTWHQQQHTTPESEIIPETTEGTNTSTTAFEPATTPEIAMTTTETTFEPTTEAQFTTTRESGTAETEDVSVDATTMEMNPTNPSICPDGFFGSVPHPEICDSYYVCTGWDPIQLFCLPGFEFDPNLQTCVEISEGGCTWSQTTTTRVTDTTIPDSSTTVSTETKPSIITELTTKEPNLLTTTEVTADHTTQELTTEKTTELEATVYSTTNNIKTDDPTTVESTTDDWIATEPQPVTPAICPDGYFGNQPHPERCDAYYLCSGWSPILLFCSNGFEFDPVTGTCVAISEGGCTWHQTSTSTTTKETTETTKGPSSSDAITEDTTQKVTTVYTEPASDSSTLITTERSIEPITEEWITSEITTKLSTISVETTINLETDDQSTTEKITTKTITENNTTSDVSTSGLTTVQSTTEGWIITTDQDTFATDDFTIVSTTTELPENTVDLTEVTTELTTTTRPICSDGFFGNVPHAEKCDAYYLCSGWNPILLFCSPGFEFDPELGYCVAITEGGCTWNQISTTSSTSSFDSSTPPSSTTSEVIDSQETTHITDATHKDTTIVVTTERLSTEFSTDNVPTTEEVISTHKTDTTLESSTEKLTTSEFSTDAITTESAAQETTNIITPGTSENIEFESTTLEVITKQTTEDFTTQKSTSESDEANTIIDEPVTSTSTPKIPTVITTTESWPETSEYSNWTTDTEISTTENWGITTEQGTTSEVTEGAVTPSICSDGYFGNIPHPDFCDAYYLCSGWNPILLFCSPGYEFDSYSSSCVVITEGGCTWLKTSTTLIIEQTTSEIAIEVNTTEWTTEGSTLDLSTNTIIDDSASASLDYTSDRTTDDWNTVTVTNEFTETLNTITEDFITTENYVVTTTTEPFTEFVPSITTDNLDITTLIEETTTSDWTITTEKLNPTTLTETENTKTSTESDLSTGTDNLVTTTKYATTDGTTTHPTTITQESTVEFNASATTEQETSIADKTTVTSITTDPTTQEFTTQAQPNITTEIDITTSDIHSTIIEITTTERVSTPSSESTTIGPTSELIVTTEEMQATTPVVCPAGYFGNLPHPERCDAYYLCSGWNPILLFCPPGQEFDPETAACVVIAEGGCTWIQTSTTAVSAQTNTEPFTSTITEEASTTQSFSLSTTETLTTETIEQESTTETSNELSTTATFTSSTADLSTVTSEFTTITTEELTTLSDLTTIDSTETVPGPIVVLTTTEKITSFDPATTESELTTPIELEGTTEALEATTPVICTDGFFGMVANAEECDAYYMCSGWMPIPLRCPSGYEFDPNTQVCVEIAEGGCTSLSMPSVAPSTESSLAESTGTASSSVDITTVEASTTEAKTEEQATSTLFAESTTIKDTEATTGNDDGLAPPNPGIPDIKETTTAIFEIVPTTIESTTTEEDIVTDREEPIIQPIPTTEATTIETEMESTTSAHETKTTADLTTKAVTVGLTTGVESTVALESSTITVVDSSTAEPTTELQEMTEGAEVTTPAICPDGFFGMVASTEECDVYYLCSGWMPIPLRCPSGYEFSSESQACILISEGGCSLGRNKIVAKAKEETKYEDEITNNRLNSEIDRDSETDNNIIEAGGNTVAVNEETTKGICKPGFYGNVKKMGSCNTFYMCIDGATIEMQCLLGTQFDATLQKCVPIPQSGCNSVIVS